MHKKQNRPQREEMSREEAVSTLPMTVEKLEAQGGSTMPSDYPNLGKYGMLAKEYLKAEHPGRHEYLMMCGSLMETLLEVELEAEQMMEALQERLRQQHQRPVTEDYLTLLRYETKIKNLAEEIMLAEVVYQKR